MENSHIVLECKRVKFFSRRDEDAFFEWAKKIKSIKLIKGVGDKIQLYVGKQEISNEDFRDIIALFNRYKVDMKQLELFLNESNEHLYYEYKKRYLINIYPSGQ